jgi:cation diffusion facilitator CzcD-associated flavoprotein CzcO
MNEVTSSEESTEQRVSRRRVAIIGSGPGGLVAAKYLKHHGFEPVVFEQDDDIGGQWNVRSPHSGVWPSMVTNTSRWLTCFSDLTLEPEVAIFPSNKEILGYLKRYARRFDILSQVRFGTRVELIERNPQGVGWLVRSNGAEAKSEIFPYVVVASGRFNKPLMPSLPGLDSFGGQCGVLHSFGYKDPESFRGKRVLVIGCAISALEIASDLAMLGALRVVSTYRRQRYVMEKLVAGIPSDVLAFSRFAALNAEVTPRELLGEKMQDDILRVFGNPEQFGAFRPAGDFLTVGRALSQHFLALVAEGRIAVKPWIREVQGRKVRFGDEIWEEFDAIILGTGFELSIPFLSPTISNILDLDTLHADLYKFTFHPDLAGLAFLGLWEQTGPYFPPLELQARWITYVWSGIRPLPNRSQMDAEIAGYRCARGESQLQAMHLMTLLFGAGSGCRT